MFSFRFRATKRRKVCDGVPVERDRAIEERRGRKEGRDRGGANGIGEFAEPPRRALRTRVRSKKRRERAVT